MLDSKCLALLVVEDDLEDEQLLQEALNEIEEQRLWGNWHCAKVVYTDNLADAQDCLGRERFDAVLLNLTLPDGAAAMDTFLETDGCACGAPVIILAEEADETLGQQLIREGAEDVLLKGELECGPLARSIRYAIERRRRNQANELSPLSDGGTGVLNRPGFSTVADHYTKLAQTQNIPLYLAALDILGLSLRTSEERESGELVLMRAADLLQRSMPASALIGRTAKTQFAIILAGMTASEAEAQVAAAANGLKALLKNRPGAAADFTMTRFDDLDRWEALLHGEAGHDSHQLAKPVMLAD